MRSNLHSLRSLAAGVALSTLASWVSAQTTVADPWVRGTVAQQKATGFFARISSVQGATLVGASSPAAGVVEIHEMSMDGTVMKMRAVPTVALPAGKAVELSPSGLHVMLMDLKQPLKAGDVVPITLVIEGRDGKRESVDVKASVRAVGAGAAKGHDHHQHGDHQGHKH